MLNAVLITKNNLNTVTKLNNGEAPPEKHLKRNTWFIWDDAGEEPSKFVFDKDFVRLYRIVEAATGFKHVEKLSRARR